MNTTPATQSFGVATARSAGRAKMYRRTQAGHPSDPGALRPLGSPHARSAGTAAPATTKPKTALLRNELGDVLRSARLRQRRTLRDVSSAARVSLGYLSEIERGHKEASSELLASICEALEMPLWATLREVADRLASAHETVSGDDPQRLQALALVR